ncbi:MAG: discoidin domain-containing protein [Colwellia sp.]
MKLTVPWRRTSKVVVACSLLISVFSAQFANADTGESIITENEVIITEYTTPDGFKHPGIRFTKDSLENLRTQVQAGQEPWASYYEGMRRRWWANLDYGPKNNAGDGNPSFDSIYNNGRISNFTEDAQAALMHSIQYVVTGNELHREKAHYILTVYSNMDASGTTHFEDSHIKLGQPMYHMVAAAEIIRSTAHEGMAEELIWTEELTNNFVDNFLEPTVQAILRQNHYFMNQFSYALIGNTAAAIFADNKAAYEQAVEWTTVNATADNQGWNGAIKQQFRWMTHDDATGEPVEPHVQLAEMGRDQPHAIGNVDSLLIISQIIASQGTKVDPVDGTISDAANAIDPIHFNDDALIKAWIEYVKYNAGFDINWVSLANSILADGTIDSLYKRVNAQQRGRFALNAVPAVYHYFNNAGYDFTEGDNKFIKLAYDQYISSESNYIRDGGYWGPKEHVYNSEFWTHLPAESADTSVAPKGVPRETLDDLPEYPTSHLKEFETRHYILDGDAEVVEEGEISYLSFNITDSTPSNFSMWQTWYEGGLNAFKVRSNGSAVLEFTRGHNLPATSTLYIPNTNGEWQYIAVDRNKQDATGIGELLMWRLVGLSSDNITVDLDHLNVQNSALLPPVFDNLNSNAISFVGGYFERDLGATSLNEDAPTLSYSAEHLPDGVNVDANTGLVSWSPAEGQEGDYQFQVIVTDGEFTATHEVSITIAESAIAAVNSIANRRDFTVKYESESRIAFDAAHNEALALIAAGQIGAEIDAVLARFLVATNNLKLLTPIIIESAANDDLGSAPNGKRLDFSKVVVESNTWLGALGDGDASSFNSRWGQSYVLMDFGANYRVTVDSFHIQARQGFPERVQGAHLLVSNDGENWTKVTNDAGYGGDMQALSVYDEYQEQGYRYLQFYAYPQGYAVFDIGELYIFGERKEVTANIASIPERWFVGDPLVIPVNTLNPQDQELNFDMVLPPSAIFNAEGGVINWTPTADETGDQLLVIIADYGFEQVVTELPIRVYLNPQTAIEEAIAGIGNTDDYTAYSLSMLAKAKADAEAVANNPDLPMDIQFTALALLEEAIALLDTKVGKIKTGYIANILASHSIWSTPSIGPEISGLPVFDGDYSTIISLDQGDYPWVQADFGEGEYVSLQQVIFYPRSDQATRLNGATISGSNDGETWVELTVVPSDRYSDRYDSSSTTLEIMDNTQYRYIRYTGSAGSYGDVAEIEYFGTSSVDVDDRTLAYLLTKAGTLYENNWSNDSWSILTQAIAFAAAVNSTESLATATTMLDVALKSMIPVASNIDFSQVPNIWFVGTPLEFSIYADGVRDDALTINVDLPQGASFNANTGVITWTPSIDNVGEQLINVMAQFSYTVINIDVSLPINIISSADAVIDDIISNVGDFSQYSSHSIIMLARAEADARAIGGNALSTVAEKLAYITLLEEAVALLDPYSDVVDVLAHGSVLASHSQWGNSDIDVTLSGLPAFDGNIWTAIDMSSDNDTWVQVDFGEGKYVSLTKVILTPRDRLGSRMNYAQIQGSNDGETWTQVFQVPWTYGTQSWADWVSTFEVEEDTEYRYLRYIGVNGSYGNIAEIEFFGRNNLDFDTRTLAYLVAKSALFNQLDWTALSWSIFADALIQAQAVLNDAESGSDAYAAATETLDAAYNGLRTGDWDRDGDVDNKDMRSLMQAIVRKQEVPMSFDLNNDGKISLLDARAMRSICTRPGCAIN